MNVAPTCTATVRQPARLRNQSFRQQHGRLPSCRSSHAANSPSLAPSTPVQRQTGLVHFCYATAAQPAKQGDKQCKPDLPDISGLKPQLQQQWHPDNNALLGGVIVKPNSSRRVMWTCPNCPAGCPHIWASTVNNRTQGRKCPYCQGRKVCKHNSLATKAPKQSRYWNHSKNIKTPEQTLAGSNSRADWKCPDCQHEWQAQIAKRVENNSGCPCCSCSNIQKSSHPTFQAAEHTLLREWDHERNAEDGIYPHNTKLQSMKLVHWVCHECPKGQLHRYQMYAYKRTLRRPQGCPYCASHKVCDCNSLAACEPSIAAEWDFARNDNSPADVTSRSHQAVWWRNDRRGSWKQLIAERTTRRKNAC